MDKIFNIYFASNRLAITSTPIEGCTLTIAADNIPSAEELCKKLNEHSLITIITPNPDEAFERVASRFVRVTAAGGLVENDKGEFLMIYRNGRWDLPKGHLEVGETLEECAVREVEEETGVGGLSLGDKICHTLHVYKMKGRWEIKQTHWYNMHSSFDQPLTPQTEEGIMRVEWCSKDSIRRFIIDSYPTIQQVFYDAKVL